MTAIKLSDGMLFNRFKQYCMIVYKYRYLLAYLISNNDLVLSFVWC